MILITIWGVAKVRERMAVSKQATQKFHVEIFNLRKLNKLEVSKQYQTEISNRFAALENINDSDSMNRALENIKRDIKSSAEDCLHLHELKQNKPWLDEECLHTFLDQRKQAKMQRI